MAAPFFDPDRAARIVIDASFFGDEKTCEKWHISRSTLQRYRTRLDGDEMLSKLVEQKRALLDASWSREVVTALRSSVAKITQLVEVATVENLRDVVGAVKVLGDLLIMAHVIGLDCDDDEPDTTDDSSPDPSLKR